MEHVQKILTEKLNDVNSKIDHLKGDIYYLEELEHYQDENKKAKVISKLKAQVSALIDIKEEIEFVERVMSEANLSEIFKKHRRVSA